jgi:hypothetical protein
MNPQVLIDLGRATVEVFDAMAQRQTPRFGKSFRHAASADDRLQWVAMGSKQLDQCRIDSRFPEQRLAHGERNRLAPGRCRAFGCDLLGLHGFQALGPGYRGSTHSAASMASRALVKRGNETGLSHEVQKYVTTTGPDCGVGTDRLWPGDMVVSLEAG